VQKNHFELLKSLGTSFSLFGQMPEFSAVRVANLKDGLIMLLKVKMF